MVIEDHYHAIGAQCARVSSSFCCAALRQQSPCSVSRNFSRILIFSSNESEASRFRRTLSESMLTILAPDTKLLPLGNQPNRIRRRFSLSGSTASGSRNWTIHKIVFRRAVCRANATRCSALSTYVVHLRLGSELLRPGLRVPMIYQREGIAPASLQPKSVRLQPCNHASVGSHKSAKQ